MLEKLARTHSKLGPKIRAEARTCSSLVFEYSYSLGARPIPTFPVGCLNDIMYQTKSNIKMIIINGPGIFDC